VEVLLAAGAPVSAKDQSFGGTPMDWADFGKANNKTGVAPERYDRVVALLQAAGGTRS
jgi:hypothetical protein